jgi:segregation and condensation protein A
LLPKPPPPVDPDAETPEEALIRRLAEYAALKEGVGRMHDLEAAAARMFEKLPEEIPLPPPTFELTNLTIEGLSAALKRVFSRVLERPDGSATIVREIPRDALSVQACMFAVAAKVRQGPCSFEGLFSEAPTRNEVVTVFMAVLELLRLGKLAIEQHDVFGDMTIYESP